VFIHFSVDRDDFHFKTSADLKFFHGILLPICHRLLDVSLDASECVSLISDLDSSIPLISQHINPVACALLPFMQTDEGSVAARILMESKSNTNVESFFSALMLQLSSRPHRISGSISLDSGRHSECALVDLHGTHLVCFTFKCRPDHSTAPVFPYQQYHISSNQKVFVEVQIGSSKPIKHIIFSSISNPPSLNFSLSIEQQGIFLLVESVPICLINTSIDMLNFSKFVCSVPSTCKVEHGQSYFDSTQTPHWLSLFLKSKFNQSAQECSPVTGSSLNIILNHFERMSLFAKQMLPTNTGDWSPFLQRAMITELVIVAVPTVLQPLCTICSSIFCIFVIFTDHYVQIDVNDESVVRELISRAVDIFIAACQPYLLLSSPGNSHQVLHEEQMPGLSSATQCSTSNLFPTPDFHIENASDSAPLSAAYTSLVNVLSLALSNCQNPLFPPTVPAEIQFQSSESSCLVSDQQTPNCVQIVYRKPALHPVNLAASPAVAKVSRKISSLPISLVTFCAKVCVKDLNASDVACVELIMYTPGSHSSARYVSIQKFHLLSAFFYTSLPYLNFSEHVHFSCMLPAFCCVMEFVLATYLSLL
jgi:hypothetical protein